MSTTKPDRRTMNADKRRALHLQVAATLRERKRLRASRAEINEALELSRLRVAQQSRPLASSVRATDKKTDLGWPIIDEDEESPVEYSTSRDKARARAKEINSTPILTCEQAMNDLGYFKLSSPGRTPEKKWARTA